MNYNDIDWEHLFTKTELPKEVWDDIKKIGEEKLNSFISERHKLEETKENEEITKEDLKQSYRNIKQGFEKYMDMKEDNAHIIALWIIGTYIHKSFPSYPYLFINAMKGSGKTRLLKIISYLAKDGEMLNSMTEAVLFRTTGTLAIDEFEGISRKGGEALRELLNSAYKEGTKVKRLKKKKTVDGESQVVEEFDVYRPIAIANIWGMENVLGDRCIPLILEKSFDKKKVNLVEIFKHDKLFVDTKKLLDRCSLCRCSFSGEYIKIYELWNNFITSNNTNTTNTINNINNTNYIQAFKTINLTDLTGRELELCFPLFLVALEIEVGLLKKTTQILSDIFKTKKDEEFSENHDISLIDFVAQEHNTSYIPVAEICRNFKEFLNTSDEWINPKWVGRALKRLGLVKEKRRLHRGIEVILNIEKAQQKIKMFK